ncbi:hypothetical protein LTR56_011602 [Elasticomyces elasticus]|nr:hypothetical protein LTR56_011602 [Elasticomyces elasticus]KAK3656969.1 hypothetical protein LTR22_009470 [Elasticomyces elasticus]KAK4908177.1 hypothetical protein LTR49_022903 [Elasticomyces elasticus]KAK5748145.1 hypothetical protein LTS12_021794 [Elasticomyces elasticus]
METCRDAPTASPLLGLAPELRNAICEQVILDELKVARVGTDGNLVNKPGLLAACRQLRVEALPVYLDLAPAKAECLTVDITDFDFTPLIFYLDTLSNEQRRAMAEKHNLRIVMTLTSDCERAGWPGARRWITYYADNLAGFDITGTRTENNAYAWVVENYNKCIGKTLEMVVDNMDHKFELMHSSDSSTDIKDVIDKEWEALYNGMDEYIYDLGKDD